MSKRRDVDEEDRAIMPPPAKVFRSGTPEMDEAVRTGRITLSPPQVQIQVQIQKQQQRRRHQERPAGGPAEKKSENFSIYVPKNQAGEYTHNEPIHILRDRAGEEAWNDADGQGGRDEDGSRNEKEDSNLDKVLEQDDLDGDPLDQEGESSIVSTSQASVPLPTDDRITFRDVIGHEQAKIRAKEILVPLSIPRDIASQVYKGIRQLPCSILLYGPPGCGKTRLARAVAGEAKAAFLPIGPSDIMSKYVGESEATIREIFQRAHKLARDKPSKAAVIFFDEIDAIGQSRGGQGGSSSGAEPFSRRILAELLIQMSTTNFGSSQESTESEHSYKALPDGESVDSVYADSASHSSQERLHPDADDTSTLVIVLAATNRPEDCDSALLRRFPVRLLVGPPTQQERVKIVKYFLKGTQHSLSAADLRTIAARTDEWSGSDLESLVREAAMISVRECIVAATHARRRYARQLEENSRKIDAQDDRYPPALIDEDDIERQVLCQRFLSMRSVTLGDFDQAIEFLSCNHTYSLAPNGEEGVSE